MKSGVVLLVTALVLSVMSAASGSSSAHLVPTAVAFRDALHGELALSSAHGGAIAVTSDGGKTWRITRHTARPLVGVALFHGTYYVGLPNGTLLPSGRFGFKGYCPKGWSARDTAEIVDTNIIKPWSICVGQPGAGNQAKAVYRGSKRVAFTPVVGKSDSGIGLFGYPDGIAGAGGGFGIIWPGGRGWVYVTRDGGHHWHVVRKILQTDYDSGVWATTAGNSGFVLIHTGAGQSRLVKTTDAGRTWHVVHRWR